MINEFKFQKEVIGIELINDWKVYTRRSYIGYSPLTPVKISSGLQESCK